MSWLIRIALSGCLAIATWGCEKSDSEKIDMPAFSVGEHWCSAKTLARQGYTGRLGSRIYVQPQGSIQVGANRYYISTFNDFSNDRKARLLIFAEVCKYVGSYEIGPRSASLEKKAIIFSAAPELGDVIEFTESGPPKNVIVDGISLEFRK